MRNKTKTRVLIIGGGVTGTGVARDLALRGVECALVEKADINAGASGANHGLLHSGARYVSTDPTSAVECREENAVLKRIAPHAIESAGGIFAAFQGDDENYAADFPGLCEKAGIVAEPLDIKYALETEPALSKKLIAAYAVNDAAVDPFMLSFDNAAHALSLGATLLRDTLAVGFDLRDGKIRAAVCRNAETGEETRIEADMVVNASGAWAGRVAELAGVRIRMACSKGSLLVTHSRLARRVLNRLRRPSDADILVPGGSVSILGTTSIMVRSPDDFHPEIGEVERIIDEGAIMVPELADTRFIRAYSGIRPLVCMDSACARAADTEDATGGRNLGRGYALIDHALKGVGNFVTIVGGKLTTYRLMAEKTADLVCEKLGVNSPCVTRTEPLPLAADTEWTEPGLAPRRWMKRHDPDDLLLCDCEMVPLSAVDGIAESIGRQGGKPSLKGIALRSRVGKGPCQGTFCSQRVVAHLYDREKIDGAAGLTQTRDFLNRRWRGQRPLPPGFNLMRYELLEAVHCGIFGLELEDVEPEK